MRFQRELKMRYTVLGVHRDDMNLYIDNNDVKEFGSQGQQRSTALALKLAINTKAVLSAAAAAALS